MKESVAYCDKDELTESIAVESIGVWHPQDVINNQYYIDYFKERGIKVDNYLKAIGVENRYVNLNPESNDNTLSMSVSAAEIAIKNFGCKAADFDMIVFVSQTPEYLIPTTSMKIHNALGCKEETLVYDMNVNCAGLVVAIDQVTKVLKSTPFAKLALVIGSDKLNIHNTDDPFYYAATGDSAVAVVLQKKQDYARYGFLDSDTFSDTSEFVESFSFPGSGLSKLHQEGLQVKAQYLGFNSDRIVDAAVNSINRILERNGFSITEVKSFLFSQYSSSNITKITERLNVDIDKVKRVSSSYGYTATTSPLIAFHEALKNDEIARGDLVVFWTLGAGWLSIATLMRY